MNKTITRTLALVLFTTLVAPACSQNSDAGPVKVRIVSYDGQDHAAHANIPFFVER